MMRGTFANIRLRNLLGGRDDLVGGVTLHLPDGEEMTIYDAAMRYAQEGTPLVVLAGEEELTITGIDEGRAREVTVRAGDTEFQARVRIDTPKEVEYFQHGGILPFVLRQLLA